MENKKLNEIQGIHAISKSHWLILLDYHGNEGILEFLDFPWIANFWIVGTAVP